MTCRINQALKLCGCVPFFYAVSGLKYCGVHGLICLSEHPWYNTTNCECMSLCESVMYTTIATRFQNLKFDRMLNVDISFPKTIIKRSVLFDFFDLVGKFPFTTKNKYFKSIKIFTVSFGGSVALFLGFSFLTGVELIYFIIEHIIDLIIKLIKKFSTHIISMHQISGSRERKY